MSQSQVAPASSFFGAALKGGAIAAVLNLSLGLVATAAGVDFMGQLEAGGALEQIPTAMFAVSSLIPAVFAGLIAWAMRKKTEKAGVIFLGLSIVFTLLSMGGPAGLVGASMGTKVVLGVMHVVAAVPITLALLKGPLRIN